MAHAQHTGRGWTLTLASLMACVLATAFAGTSSAANTFGTLQGIVVNPGGTPQMGANVKLVAEDAASALPTQLFTNQRGTFSDMRVPAGIYEVQVSLAGYLSSVQHHIQVVSNVTTIVKVQLTTVFASLDRLRRSPAEQSNATDDWKWVLRSASATRPVLDWTDPQVTGSTQPLDSGSRRARAQLDLTSGSQHPGSISNLPDAPGTAFGYDQPIGSIGKMLFAGQMSYGQGMPAAGFAATWLPSGDAPGGSVTEMAIRQAWLGPGDLTFRGERVAQHNTMAIGDRVILLYGAELVSAQLEGSTRSMRPSAEVRYLLSPSLQATVMVVSGTASDAMPTAAAPTSAIEQFNNFPVLMLRDGHPILAGGWHEEAGVRYKVSKRAVVEAAGFHDQSGDTPLFGRGVVGNPDYLQDPFSNAFVYDAGGMGSWGARIAYKQKLSDDFDIAAIYSYAGAMTPENSEAANANPGELRDELISRYRHSLAARLGGKSHRTGTQFAVSYKWINGQAVTRMDPYGEAMYELDPYLSLSIRQALPGTVWNCRWEALADFRNLLGQGYVPVSTQDGQLVLMSAARSFRGGISLQF